MRLVARLGEALARHGRRPPAPFVARRLAANPIVVGSMLPGEDGANINGPSLIAAPDWLPGRLARYYLYFAHHDGRYVRLALADDLAGPWRIHAPGTLHCSDAGADVGHIASPDVHVDEARKRIVLYFHAATRGERRQYSHVAFSGNGIDFAAEPARLADFYLRVVPWRDRWVGMSKGGRLYLQEEMGGPLAELPDAAFRIPRKGSNAPGAVRHVALACRGDRLDVFFTRIGDAPERILMASIDLSLPPGGWRARNEVEILRPTEPWEGADLAVAPSRSGTSRGRENALRDPAIFHEDDRTYLLYSVAGEHGIAVAELEGYGSCHGSRRPAGG